MADERRVSTPLVLALASGMLAVAFVVYLGLDEPPGAATYEEAEGPAALHIDDRTPEATAESFYDAWRRRRWDAASGIATGEALRAVQEKQRADEAMPHEERVIAERAWDALAHAELHLLLDRVDIVSDDRYDLGGTAEYQLVGRPYRRRVEFAVVREGEAFRVERMELGEVLTELPDLFRAEAQP